MLGMTLGDALGRELWAGIALGAALALGDELSTSLGASRLHRWRQTRGGAGKLLLESRWASLTNTTGEPLGVELRLHTGRLAGRSTRRSARSSTGRSARGRHWGAALGETRGQKRGARISAGESSETGGFNTGRAARSDAGNTARGQH
jgi:hypothetical protein